MPAGWALRRRTGDDERVTTTQRMGRADTDRRMSTRVCHLTLLVPVDPRHLLHPPSPVSTAPSPSSLMSGIQESEAKQRAARREAERQRQREERQAQASSRRAARQGTTEEEDDPNDPLAAERRIWREKQRAKAAASGGSSTAAVGSEMSQEDAMIAHANKLQEENRQTLKNTIRVARETTEVGAATISKLDQQTGTTKTHTPWRRHISGE